MHPLVNALLRWPLSLLALTFTTLFVSRALTAQEEHRSTPGNGPQGFPETVFVAHALGTDRAEGITTLDMNDDGLPDLVSGAYWYQNPGSNGGEWIRHQYRTVGILGEFVSDCGEWTIDVNHDGRPDVVTAGWMVNGLYWFQNPGPTGGIWQPHLITDSYDTEGGTMGGREVPDVMLALFDYAEGFNLSLRVNFVDGGEESEGLIFTGSEGTMEIAGNSVSVGRTPRETEPGYTVGTFSEEIQEQTIAAYRTKYPAMAAPPATTMNFERYVAPPHYSDSYDHFSNFFSSVRSRKPVVEDAVFGFRAAGAALLSNLSYERGSVVHWNAEEMKLV